MFQLQRADIGVPYSSAPLTGITLGQRAVVKSVRSIHWLLLPVAAALLWGCASSSVGLQSNGSYVLERGEQAADCQALHKNIWGRIQVLKGLPAKAKAERDSVPTTTSSLFGRWFGGPNKGLSAIQEYNRERAHVYALRRTMVEKKCVDVDVDAELAAVDADMRRFSQQ